MASMVIENGDVIDGMGNEPQRGMDVVIDGNRIAEVRPAGERGPGSGSSATRITKLTERPPETAPSDEER